MEGRAAWARRSGRLRCALQRAALAAAGLGLGLLIAEVGFRLAGYTPGGLLRYDPVVGWSVRQEVTWRFRTPEYRTVIRTNDQGLRGPPFPVEKPPGETRVLVLGDSFVLALEVPWQATLGARLEERLRGARGDVRVLPAACTAWGTDQEYLYLRERGVRFSPDVVVLVFFTGNDLSDIWRTSMPNVGSVAHKPWFRLEGSTLVPHQLPVPREEGLSLLSFLKRHSAVVSFLRQEIVYRVGFLTRLRFAMLPQPVKDPRASALSEEGSSREEVLELAWALIRETRREAERAGARFLLVVAPTLEQVKGDQSVEIAAFLESRAMEEGVPCVPLLRVLEGRLELYFPSDRHWNEAGHRAVAEAVGEAVRAMLPGPAPVPSGGGE